MKVSELTMILGLLGVPDTIASVGRLRDDHFCLVPGENGTYEVFWYERGSRIDRCVYDSESAACFGFLGMVGGGLTSPQPLAPRTGTAGSTGGAPYESKVVQSLLDVPDLFGGMTEAEWARQYVVPEDLGASAGNRRLRWPDPNLHPEGFSSPTDRKPIRIPVNRKVDSFGPTFTKFLYDAGAPLHLRSIPYDYARSGYRRYLVVKPPAVWAGTIAPWFGLPGGATQYFTVMPVVDLIGAGFLQEIPL